MKSDPETLAHLRKRKKAAPPASKAAAAQLTVYTIPLDADFRPVSPDWLEGHERAWGAYRRGDFAAARALFAEALVEGDVTMAEMVRRCREYEAHPPGPGWEAVVALADK